MATLFQYFTGSLRELIEQSLVIKDRLLKKNVGGVSNRLIEDLANCGVIVDATYLLIKIAEGKMSLCTQRYIKMEQQCT